MIKPKVEKMCSNRAERKRKLYCVYMSVFNEFKHVTRFEMISLVKIIFSQQLLVLGKEEEKKEHFLSVYFHLRKQNKCERSNYRKQKEFHLAENFLVSTLPF